MIIIITIHANGVCVKGWLEKKGKYSRKSHEWQPLFRAHHYHQHHHHIIAINIIITSSQSTSSSNHRNQHHHQIIAINTEKIMVIIDKNSEEAKTFYLHPISVHVHLT